MMLNKIVLIAHHEAGVRDRFAAAMADARHSALTAATAEAATAAAEDAAHPVSLVIVDLGLREDAVEWLRQLRGSEGRPILVFAGTVHSAADARALLTIPVAGYINEYAESGQILPAVARHLFPASFDRRLSPRVSIGVPVSFKAGGSVGAAVTLNLGRGGMAIRTLSPASPGTMVEVRFRLPSSAEVETRGRVTWADRKVGMGIQFEWVSAGGAEALDTLMGGPG